MRFVKAIIIAVGLAQISAALQIDTVLYKDTKIEASPDSKPEKIVGGKPRKEDVPHRDNQAQGVKDGSTTLGDSENTKKDEKGKLSMQTKLS